MRLLYSALLEFGLSALVRIGLFLDLAILLQAGLLSLAWFFRLILLCSGLVYSRMVCSVSELFALVSLLWPV